MYSDRCVVDVALTTLGALHCVAVLFAAVVANDVNAVRVSTDAFLFGVTGAVCRVVGTAGDTVGVVCCAGAASASCNCC